MDRTVAVTMAIAALMVICAVPLASEESDADTTTTLKLSEQYIYYGTFIMPEGEFNWTIGGQFMFVDGSEEHSQMLAYLEDPLHNDAPSRDNSAEISHGMHAGELIHAYSWQSSDNYPYINTYDGRMIGDIVLEPYGENLDITVRPGDTFTITLLSTTSHRDLYINTVGNQTEVSLGDTFSVDVNSLTTFNVGLGQYSSNNDLYVIYTFSYDGGSEPNGSATVFAAICFMIAALVIALLVVASMRPKWSS